MGVDDAVFLQVLNNQLRAVVDEMAQNVLRAAHSTYVKETWDLGALLYTPSGEAFACPKGIAEKRLGKHLGATLELAGEPHPGDIFVTNDPMRTGGMVTHLPDINLWKPIFWNGELVCYALAYNHVSDVGGAAPGSISPKSVDLYQEGLTIPPVRLFADGELREDIREMILANSRVPRQIWGDMTAVVGALNVAERRLHELLAQHSLPQFRAGVERLIELSERRARDLIREMPDGRYTFVDYIDGLPDMEPIRICLALDVQDDTITMDFAGSSPEVRAAYNLHSHSKDGHMGLTRGFPDYFQTLDPDVPWNSGLVRPILVRAPRGSVVNPSTAAACGSRASTYFRIYYMIFGALAQAVPGAVPASGPGECGVMLIAAHDPVTGERKMNLGEPLFGGGGARRVEDGFDGNEFVSGYLRNVSVEILEAEMPARIVEYGFASGTGGAGRNRGGVGVRVMVEFLTPFTTVTIRGIQRHQFRAWGVDGGQAGARGTVVINPGRPDQQELNAVAVLTFQPGDLLRVTTAGGGGYGDPLEREPERVARDVAEGYLDLEAALADYGVVLLDGKPDPAGTEAARKEMRARRAPLSPVDYGPERAEYDRIWTPEIHAQLERLTAGRTPVAAQYLREQLVSLIRGLVREGRPVPAPERLMELLAAKSASAARR